ncbi:ubiquitin carboxyl-terminal hydrolase 10-like [Uloborus diversus]|uniref:ubiquitin carboxyl-terminal hydrolase 10-like n=1 Tax=Uloborus diversus TaxID=327109 RepID=UPI0024098459|nr:ubiquitin carboxyl-terminal hydrolase 10-like [Uloborus diversus]
MDKSIFFLNLDGLDDSQVEHIQELLHPLNFSDEVEFPWNDDSADEPTSGKGCASTLNVHAPVFETYVSKISNHTAGISDSHQSVSYNDASTELPNSAMLMNLVHPVAHEAKNVHSSLAFHNGSQRQPVLEVYNNNVNQYCEPRKNVNGDLYSTAHSSQIQPLTPVFKLNPTVSCFVPQNIKEYTQQPVSNGIQTHSFEAKQPNNEQKFESNAQTNFISNDEQNFASKDYQSHSQQNIERDSLQKKTDASSDVQNGVASENRTEVKQIVSNDFNEQVAQNGTAQKQEQNVEKLTEQTAQVNVVATASKNDVSDTPVRRSWADVVSSGQRAVEKIPVVKSPTENEKKPQRIIPIEQESDTYIDEDKMCLVLGKHLYQSNLNFQPVFFQPRGLINKRNWCYINATLQALLACSPFYTLLRNLPIGPCVDRGKSATPVTDSMVKVVYEFTELQSQQELQVGQPFQPDFIYDMLKDLKSDCLKGQQEDAEEFLSFILNNMHEEMVKLIKNYEKKNHLELNDDLKENGDVSEGEEEWQVIGSKHKGMVTRKVAEHKTPISDLLGGQIKSFLTTSGNKTSASIQPFFTLQLDIQSENVNSVAEALKEMTVKEPIQGYTCAKTKQEVEAYSHIALQKLPPILILHLKRFVYNKTGGCKKVMKKTDYPLQLELSKDLFSSDVKKNQRIRTYNLFGVMYHDGEEAVKGHYISDVYNHGSQTWIRCDDRTVSAVTEAQVLSHSPPRVPYLLFYQESSSQLTL